MDRHYIVSGFCDWLTSSRRAEIRSMVRRNTSSRSAAATDSTGPSTARVIYVNEVPNSIQLTMVFS